ncbi:TPA: transposase family protein, partial [Candidatus Poribacteria bacterium]|nr:transposase family protein [Candidatus Poribacteria bacterium]
MAQRAKQFALLSNTDNLVVFSRPLAKRENRGRPAKLSCSDQLLMTLMYWREYR